jgi:hypothetical protein
VRVDPVKFVNHADDHPTDPILRVRPLAAEEIQDFLGLLASALFPGATTGLLERLVTVLQPVVGVNADDPYFDPTGVLGAGATMEPLTRGSASALAFGASSPDPRR